MPKHVGFLIDDPAILRRDNRTGVDVEIGLPREIGAAGQIGLDRRFERPEALAECDLMIVVKFLVAEQQQRVFLESGADLDDSRVVKRPNSGWSGLTEMAMKSPRGRRPSLRRTMRADRKSTRLNSSH